MWGAKRLRVMRIAGKSASRAFSATRDVGTTATPLYSFDGLHNDCPKLCLFNCLKHRDFLTYGVCAMLSLQMPRRNRPGSPTGTRLKPRGREVDDLVLDAGERRLVKSVERGKWTTVAEFRAAKARHARSATATLRRLHKA